MLKSLVLATLVATPLLAQQEPKPVRDAAAGITAADVHMRLAVIADDSMGGRDTPSDGLNKTAQYVANQFRRFGLRPGGENGTYFQRYAIERRRFDAASSTVMAMGPGGHAQIDLAHDAFFSSGSAPAAPVTADAVALGVTLLPEQLDKGAVQGKIVLVVDDYTKTRPATSNQLYGAIRDAGALAILRVSNRDSVQFFTMVSRMNGRERVVVGSQATLAPIIEVRDAFTNGMGLDLAAIRGGQAAVRAVAGTKITVTANETLLESTTAPNTIGILPGSDPVLKNEYVIFSGHMDHIGIAGHGSGQCQALGADSICNGADDDGSGTTGVMEMAQAFSRRGVRPKRSMIFMTVSGEEKGLWGSNYFVEHPTVNLQNVIADFNIDMIGRNWDDTVVAIGRQHSNLGQVLDDAGRRHPELRMTPIDDIWPQENFYFRSDHFNFARKGVPILFFFTGTHEDYHKAGDEVSKIGFDKEARILQLLFYTAYSVVNNPVRPQWNPDSYQQIVEPAARAARAAAGH